MTESSVKNFQLCVSDSSLTPSEPSSNLFNGNGGGVSSVSSDDVVLQFGRVAKHKFTLDVKYPLSLVQVRQENKLSYDTNGLSWALTRPVVASMCRSFWCRPLQ